MTSRCSRQKSGIRSTYGFSRSSNDTEKEKEQCFTGAYITVGKTLEHSDRTLLAPGIVVLAYFKVSPLADERKL